MLESQKRSVSGETVVLVGLVRADVTLEQTREYLFELAFLVQAAGGVVRETFYQKAPHPDPKTFLGKGKLCEIYEYIAQNRIDLAVFDDELSASQAHNIHKILRCRVLDRSGLILDIFARRARTAQARAQVLLAQCQYLLPRLKGFWTHLERQGGGIGTRGPGEREIETDRRIIQEKISHLKRELVDIDKRAQTQRKQRSSMVRVGLVGYTNVGKSTLLNILAKESVLVENQLFATLDTTTRKIVIDSTPFLLSDTVGFIRKLPHHLVESFRSTLDEVRESDILVQVHDVSQPCCTEYMDVVKQTLEQIGATPKRSITVFNKVDHYCERHFDEWTEEGLRRVLLEELHARLRKKATQPSLLISAHNPADINELKRVLVQEVRKVYEDKYPYRTRFYCEDYLTAD